MLEQYYIQYDLNVSEHQDPRSRYAHPSTVDFILVMTVIARQ